MDWVQCLSKAILYIEHHLSEDISMENISRQAYASTAQLCCPGFISAKQ